MPEIMMDNDVEPEKPKLSLQSIENLVGNIIIEMIVIIGIAGCLCAPRLCLSADLSHESHAYGSISNVLYHPISKFCISRPTSSLYSCVQVQS